MANCYAELAVSSPAVTETIASTDEGMAAEPSGLDECRDGWPVPILTRLDFEGGKRRKNKRLEWKFCTASSFYWFWLQRCD